MSQTATDDLDYHDVDPADTGQTWLGAVLAATAAVLGVVTLVAVVSLIGADGPVTLWRWVLTIGPLLVALAALVAWRMHSDDEPLRTWSVRRRSGNDADVT